MMLGTYGVFETENVYGADFGGKVETGLEQSEGQLKQDLQKFESDVGYASSVVFRSSGALESNRQSRKAVRS